MEATTTASPEPKPQMSPTCALCNESFEIKDPQLLPCLHSFCKSCLNNGLSDDCTTLTTCPTCKQKYSPQDVIENRFIIEQLNLRAPKQEENQENFCTGCDENIVASSYCVDCMEWLCDACVQAHRRVRVTKDHVIESKETAITLQENAAANMVKAEKNYPRCPIHKKELLKLYCDTCEQLTCRDCQLLDHKDHKYNFIDNHGEKYKDWMKDMLKRIIEKRAYIENAKVLINRRFNDIREKEQKVGNEIKMFAIKFITDINKRGKELLSDLNAVCSAKRNQLDQKHGEILNLSKKLDHAMLFTEEALNHGSSQALLYTKKTLCNQLLNVLRTRCEVPNPNHQIDIKFNYDNQILKTHIPTLGRLQVDGITYNGPHSPQGAKAMSISSPSTGSVSFNSLTPEQKNHMLLRMTSQHRQALLASSPVGSPSGLSPVNFPPGGPGGKTQVGISQRSSGKGYQSRSQHPRPILPKPQGGIDLYIGSAAGGSQALISSTSAPQTCPVPTSTTAPSTNVTNDCSGSSPSSSTGADNTRPSSSDSAQVGGAKNDCGSLNPTTFSFDTDPASLTNINIKKELTNEAETLNPSRSPPQSPGSTNQGEAYNLNESIGDQVVGFQQQPTCMPESNDPNEDYCACCHNGGDLLCCDTCPYVFHFKCHVPELVGPPTGNWSCGLCIPDDELMLKEPDTKHDLQSGERKRKVSVGLTEREIRVCERILLQLFCHPTSPPFHEPVSKSIPNYHKIITNPMDFTTIRCKLSPKHFNHYACLDDVVSDVRLVFINCAKYNSECSEVGKAGRDVEKYFDNLLKQFAPWYQYIYSHEVRDTDTPNSDKSDASGRPNKRKKRPEDVVHVL